MKLSADLVCASPVGWIDAVMEDFDAFLLDHANCERKASSMAMSFVARYPDRVEIIPELIETAIEELEHFQKVYALMEQRNLRLPHKIAEDTYVKELLSHCRTGRDERFIDQIGRAHV
jgi:tRNA 2-(methylsulfanyl)-N6-isopentenyladenosine37 hydroxylase